MEYASTQRDLEDYSQAVQSYAQDKSSIADRNARSKEDADTYNETMRSIVDPIGGEILKKPLIKGLKSGLKKVLGRGKSIVSGAAEDLKAGVNPTTRIVAGAKKTIADVKNTVVETKNDVQKLAKGTRKVLNDARQSIGKKPFKFDKEKFLREAKKGEGFGQSNPDLNYNPNSLSDIPKSEGSLVDPLQSDIGRATASLDDRATVSGMDSLIKRVGGNRMSLQEGLTRAQNPSADADALDSLSPMRNAGGGAGKSFQAPKDVDPLTGKANVPPPTEEPGQTPKVKAPKGKGSGAEDDAEDVLDKDPAADVEIAGGGPEDIFTDILAGLIGIGTLIGGAVGGKKATKVTGQAINPSSQFGI